MGLGPPVAERLDSRRLPGTSLLWDRPSAVIDASVNQGDAARVTDAWSLQARRMLDAVGWAAEALIARDFHGGVSVAMSAPIDALYAATELNEWAWDAGLRALGGDPPSDDDVAAAAALLMPLIAAERRPRLLDLEVAATAHGVALVFDDQRAGVGLAAGSVTWSLDDIPSVADIAWDSVHDVPVALVTGTNGKTTTARMLGAMIAASGLVPGISTTDGVRVGSENIATGDYSGPEGARLVLRDRRVQVAVLETARGGILRRGLTVRRADAALVTNIADDHMGEFGVHDLHALAQVKMVVGRVVTPQGRLILNADDPLMVAVAGTTASPAALAWFSLDARSPTLVACVASGGDAAFLRDGSLVLVRSGRESVICAVADIPATLRGAAKYNVANALGAILLGASLGLSEQSMREGLCSFNSSPQANPGRLNIFEVNGATFLVDFAHNPHGLSALLTAAAAMPARRRLVLIGQAGDRDETSIRGLARTAWESKPDRIIIKEMPRLLRGRVLGEIPALMEDELRLVGAPQAALEHAPSELDGVRQALAWAHPGDLLVLTIHSDRKQVLADLARACEDGA